MTPEEQAAEQLTMWAQEGSTKFFQMMQQRHEMGEEKYGPIAFMEKNTLIEAMEEVVDMANYALYTFMKLWVLNQQIQTMTQSMDGVPTLGADSFQPNVPTQRSGE